MYHVQSIFVKFCFLMSLVFCLAMLTFSADKLGILPGWARPAGDYVARQVECFFVRRVPALDCLLPTADCLLPSCPRLQRLDAILQEFHSAVAVLSNFADNGMCLQKVQRRIARRLLD